MSPEGAVAKGGADRPRTPPAARYRAVLFDLGGTLLDPRDPVAWADAARPLGVEVDPEHLAHIYETVDLECDAESPPPPPAEFWRRVFSRAAERPVPPAFGEAFAARESALPPSVHLFSDARRCLVDLDRQGRRLGIVSNSRSEAAVREYLERAGISGFFEVVVSSGTEGVAKPDPEIFRRAVGRLGLRPAEAFFVGDQPNRDARGARAAGLGSVWLHRAGFGYGEDPPEITSLAELPDYLTGIEGGSLK